MAVNDDIYTYLARLGYSGAFNDKLYKHLTDEGFLQQSLTDKLAAAGGYKSYVLGTLLSDSIVGSLFYAGEQGVWYDPNDLTTLYQDSVGTTPVTAAGQPVGLMLDKSKGLVRGVELVSNGNFDSGSGWSLGSGWSISAGKLTATAAADSTQTTRNIGAGVVGVFYSVTLTISNRVAGGVRINRGGVFGPTLTSNGTHTFYIPASNTGVTLGIWAVGVTTLDIDDISVRELPGNHALQSTAASRPILRRNATTGAYYLETDGVDDWMQTNNIDFTGTDKMSVFAGIRKLSDAARGMFVELSANVGLNNGTFFIDSPSGAANNITFAAKGTVSISSTISGLVAPISLVVSADANIPTDSARVRVNGGTYVAAAGDLGAGSYGNYPLYLFRRGGTTIPFNGHFYGLIIVGRLASATEITNIERILANKIGVTLA